MNFKYESYDKAHIERCKYILCLDNDRLIKEMYDPTELDQCGFRMKDLDSYVDRVRKLCKRFIHSPDPENESIGKLKQIYRYSKTYRGKGRLFVYGFGLQGLQNKLRSFLCEGIYRDYDIVNSAPTIVYNMIKDICPDQEFKFLHKYITQRQKFLELTDCSKTDIIIRFFSDKLLNNKGNVALKRFDMEIKKIQKLLWDFNEYPDLKETTKKNKMGSYLSKVYHVKEDIILQKSKGKYTLGVPMFDGSLIEVDQGVEEDILDTFNKNPYKVKFINKPLESDIVVDKDILDMYDDTMKDYESVKDKFEENHFFIRHPPTYGEILKDTDGIEHCYIYKKTDFYTLVEDTMFEEVDNIGLTVERSFFTKWAKDKNKRSYDKVDFIPCDDIDEKIFNTFTGFRVNKLTAVQEEYVYNQDAVKTFTDHIKLLVGNEEDAYRYVLNYFAHMYQKPEELPDGGVALLFKSPQGCGKDTLMDFHSAIMGKEYLFRTEDIEKCLGKFNDQIQKKIIIQLNEVCGADGFKYKESLKNVITAPMLNINPKGRTPYDIQNFARIVIFTNNNNIIDIPYDDRRYCVFYCDQKREKKYYTEKLRPLLKDDNALRSIYEFFLTLDIPEGFNFETDRPKTQAYQDMVSNNISPVYTYLHEVFKADQWKAEFEEEYKTHKKTGMILIQSTPIWRNFKYYMENKGLNHYKVDFKKLKSILSGVGIQQKDAKIGGKSPTAYYWFDIPKLLEQLKIRGINDDIEEFDEDDFE